MKEYSPRLRTALVLTGAGTSGAYHAGALRALEESGVKIDLVVGSGVGTVAAAFAAVAGGAKLYGPQGFWDQTGWHSFYRLRMPVRVAILLVGCSFGVFLMPLILGLAAGVLSPLVLIVDLVAPGLASRVAGALGGAPTALGAPYLAALAVPVFLLSILAVVWTGRLYLRDRRRFLESFESFLDAGPAADRLARGLWDVVRGAAPGRRPGPAELGRRFVSLVQENFGQPGFREVVVRAADLDTGDSLSFALLRDPHRAVFTGARRRGRGSRADGAPDAIDLTAEGHAALLFDAVLAGLLPPATAPVRRVSFPRTGPFAGQIHRLTDASLAGGSGIAEAVAAGAEQVILVTGVPERPTVEVRRRGPRALANGLLSLLERRAVQADLRAAERMNRMVETLGHATEDGGRAWEDPASGRVFRDLPLYVIRPDRRPFGPLELDGAQDPATEVLASPADFIEQGYRDAYRLFVEPVVGASPEPGQKRRPPVETTQPVQL
jgi:hypothetical protein